MLDLFITGADEYSDKIFVTAGLAATMQSLGYSCGVYKPVDICAVENNGYIQSPDLLFVKFVDPYIKTYFSYLFKSNSAPILAAAAEKVRVQKKLDMIVKKDARVAGGVNCTNDVLNILKNPLAAK